MAKLTLSIVAAAVIAVGLGGCGHQRTADEEKIWLQQTTDRYLNTPERRAAEEAVRQAQANEQQLDAKAFALETQIYGRQAVLECRSRMLSFSAYQYCLEANKGR